ncbi:MAG: AAA family ATPase [Bacteroidales bacterium]|nr:AAA family ATPase [Bacteroidales bacterium]
MFNKDILKAEIEKYKEKLKKNGWKDNSKKLQSVKMFQNNWDIDAVDFVAMLKKSIMNNDKLLGWKPHDNRERIISLAENDPEEVHNMFAMLYDESKFFVDRIEEFKKRADAIKINHKIDLGNGVTQNENTITTYLWLRFPDKYFIYQIKSLPTLSEKLESSYNFPKQNDYVNNLRNFLAFYEEIRKYVANDAELCDLYKKAIAGKDNCYQDPEFVSLTLDLAYEICHPASEENDGGQDGFSEEEEVSLDDFASTEEPEDDTPLMTYAESIKPPYTKEMFLNEVFMTEEDYDRIRSTLEYKKNIILQGPPGVGKTFAAKRLAYSIMGKKDDDRICIVQFHQNFSYEDFVMGYKPKKEGGYELKHGSFYNFCKKAEKDPENDYFFIIDEINRGNISKIFGELLMLIENEYRGEAGRALGISLAYDEAGEPFSVPENLYIIGMMNTADRSLALIDYALRRRFSFFEMKPAFGTVEDDKIGGFWNYVRARDSRLLEKLIETTQRLNEDIKKTLGSGFMIGHSYFCGLAELTDEDLAERLKAVVYCDIIPTLKEYWFDDERDLKIWEDEFSKVI